MPQSVSLPTLSSYALHGRKSDGVVCADIFDAAVEFEAAALRLLYPTVDLRESRLRTLLPSGGIVELQLEFPSAATASEVSGGLVWWFALVISCPHAHVLLCRLHAWSRLCCICN